jgi:guanylate kinase
LKFADQFDTVIVNHQLDKAKEETLKIVSSFIGR